MRFREYLNVAGKPDVGLRFPRQPFLDGYENPFPKNNFDPRPLSARVASEIEKLESQGKKARDHSFVVIPQIQWNGRKQTAPSTIVHPPIIRPNRSIWDRMGNRTFYRLYGLRYFSGRNADPETCGIQTAFQRSRSRVFIKDVGVLGDSGYPIASTINYFPSTTVNKWYMGILVEGETAAGQLSTSRGDVVGAGAGSRGAFLRWTGTAGGSMVQTSPQNKYPIGSPAGTGLVFGQHVENLGFDAGGSAPGTGQAGIGLDLSSQESGLKTLVRNCWLGRYTTNATGVGNWFSTVALVLDGSENGLMDGCFEAGTSAGTSSTGSAIDVSWAAPSGNLNIYNCQMAGTLSMFIDAQIATIVGTSAYGNMKISGTAGSGLGAYSVISCYFANSNTTVGIIQLGGFTVRTFKFVGCILDAKCPLIVGSGTVTNLSFSGNVLNGAVTTPWTGSSPTITKQSTDGTNYETSGAMPTGSPFTRDANGNW